MNVRPATADDVEGIRRVAQASWNDDYPTILSRETVDDAVDEWYDPERMREELQRSVTVSFVADADGDVVGFSHALWNREDGVVFRLYVHPDHRHRGIGTELLDRTCDELFDRDVDAVRAMVLAENELGNAFYRHYGFEKESEDETTIAGTSYPENVYVLEAFPE
ncbi:GNAT family N-acetyltransferase [Halobacteriaceae archaeon GCM10025711]